MKTDDAPKSKLDKQELLNRYSALSRLPLTAGLVQELPLQYLSWRDFEALIFRVLCAEYGQEQCTPYGYPGQDQEGLDILVSHPDGIYSVYQCKRVQKFSGAEFTAEFNLFRKGDWYAKAGAYYLVSSDALQDPGFVKAFEEHRQEHLERMILVKMGANDLNEKLRRLPQLVTDFFGEEYARYFCREPELSIFLKGRLVQPLMPVHTAPLNYIPRKLSASGSVDRAEESREIVLFEAFSKQLAAGDHPISYLIRSNAAFGKTTELQQLVHQVLQDLPGVLPLLARLKHYLPDTQTIEQYLEIYYPDWSNFTHTRVLVVMDGIDEIPIGGFSKFTRTICSFLSRYPEIHVVMTLRTNFHNSGFMERINEKRTFKEFSLEELSKAEIDEFVLANLSSASEAERFRILCKQKLLDDLLAIPFYLVNLLDLFSEKNAGFPKGRREAMDAIIRRRCVLDSAKYDLSIHPADLFKLLKLLSVVLTLKGKNSALLSEIGGWMGYSLDQMKLSSLIQVEAASFDHRVSFIHANFQEYLFALSILGLRVDQLSEILFSSYDRDRLKPKFLNVTNYLFSIMDHQSSAFIWLFGKLFDHNFESLALFEKDKMSLSDRLLVFNKIIGKYRGFEFYFLRDNLVSAEKLWEYVNYSPAALDTLLTCVHTQNSSSCAAFLDLLMKYPADHLSPDGFKKVHHLLLGIVRFPDYEYFIHDRAIDQMVLFNMFDENTLLAIMACPTIDAKMVRAAIFDYIVKWGKANEHLPYLLESAPFFTDRMDKVAAGLETKYVRTLSEIMDKDNYRQIMGYLLVSGKLGIEIFVNAGYSPALVAKFYTRLGDIYKLGPEFHDSETMLLDFYGLAPSHKKEKLGSLVRFYQACDRVLEGITAMIAHKINGIYAFAWIEAVDAQFLVLLLAKYTVKEIDITVILQVRLGLGRMGQVGVQQAFQKMLTKMFPGEFDYAPLDDSWETLPVIKRANDYMLLADKALFLQKAVEVFSFMSEKTGKTELELMDLMNFQHSELTEVREVCNTDLVFDTIRKTRSSFDLDAVKKLIAKKDWEEMVFSTVKSWLYYQATPPVPENLKLIAAGFYNRVYRPHLNFETAVSQKAGEDSFSVSDASAIYMIFVRQEVLRPDIEELKNILLLDYSGHYDDEPHQEHILHKGPISKLVYERLNDPELFNQTLIDHLSKGRVKSNPVMMSFATVIRNFQIPVSGTLTLNLLKDSRWGDRTKNELLKTYLHLGGEASPLMPLMHGVKVIDSEWKWNLLQVLENYQGGTGTYVHLTGSTHPDNLTHLLDWEGELLLYGLQWGSVPVWTWFFGQLNKTAKLDCSEQEVNGWVGAVIEGCSDHPALIVLVLILLEKEMLSTTDKVFCRKQILVLKLLRKVMVGEHERYVTIMTAYQNLIKKYEENYPAVKDHYYHLYALEREYYLDARDNPDEHLIPQVIAAVLA